MPTINLASKYAPQVDERFTRESQATLVTNNSYDFHGVKSVFVYSIPTVPLTDYKREGVNRYGEPSELGTDVQEMTITQDKGWTFTIDKGNKIQSQMVLEAGIPFYDAYVFKKLAVAACAKDGHSATTAVTKSNAYEQLLNAQEVLGNANVPDSGRVALCSYKFVNLLKLDPSFVKYGDMSQEMLKKGIVGEVDGVKIVRVPATRLPEGCDFILTHPSAAVAPRQLNEYKIHTDPVGISGWVCEGRQVLDCFVLNNKADAIFYHGTKAVTEE